MLNVFGPRNVAETARVLGLDGIVVAMGPAARHVSDDDLGRLLARLPEVVGATVAVDVSVYRRLPPR